jgi:hypothetical protein
MANTRLILRKLNSNFPTPFEDVTLNSVLSHDDLDNNFIYLKSELVYTATTDGTILTFSKIGGGTIDVDLQAIVDSTDNYTTGATLYNDMVYFDRSDQLSAYTLDLTSFNENFANTDLVLDNNRLHDLSSYNLTFSGGNIGVDTLSPSEKLEIDSGNIQLTNANGVKIGTNIIDGGTGFFGPVNYLQMRTKSDYSEPWFFMNANGGTQFGRFIQFALGSQTTDIGATIMKPASNLGQTSNNQLAIFDNSGLYTVSNSFIRDTVVGFFAAEGSATSSVKGSVGIASSAATLSQDYTLYTDNLNIIQLPALDNSLSQVLVRDGVSGNVKYKEIASFTDMVVTGGTYDINTGIVTFTNNSGGTFDVSGFTSGMTDSYTTTANTVGNVIQFDNNIQGSNLYSVDLSDMLSNAGVWTAGTNDNTAVLSGSNSTASGLNSVAQGIFTIASGTASHSEGLITTASGDYSHAGGQSSIASGSTSFIHSTNSLVTGVRSAVLGGQNITGTTDDTVYVPNLNIDSVPPTATATDVLVRESNGNITVTPMSGITGGIGGKYAADVPMTASTAETVTHSLGSTDVVVQIKDGSGELIIPTTVNNYTINSVDIEVSITGTYRVIVIG